MALGLELQLGLVGVGGEGHALVLGSLGQVGLGGVAVLGIVWDVLMVWVGWVALGGIHLGLVVLVDWRTGKFLNGS